MEFSINIARSKGKKVKVKPVFPRNVSSCMSLFGIVLHAVHVMFTCCTSEPFQTGKNPREKCTVRSSAGYINRSATAIAITTVHRSLQSTSRCRDGIRYLHTYFVTSPATMKFTCSKCNKVFARNYHLLRHIRTACNSNTTTVCSKCGMVFGKNYNLQRQETTYVVSPPLPKKRKGKMLHQATRSLAKIPSVCSSDFHSPMLCQHIC